MQDYQFLDILADGKYGKVHKVRRISDEKHLVCKSLQYISLSDKEKQQMVSEVNILRDLRHPNIVRYYEYIIDKSIQTIYLIMEYCEKGDLSTKIRKMRKNNESFSEESIWKMFLQLVLALHEIHRRKEGVILHRDIKPANIFIDSQENVKLGDFGFSKALNEENFACTKAGTLGYMSPEQLNEHKYNEKSDIWSLGCVLYEICCCKQAFDASNELALAIRIKDGKIDSIPNKYGSELQRVVKWCLSINFNDRPSVEELLNLPQISLRLREKRLKENHLLIKKREEDIKNKENNLKNYENLIVDKMNAIEKEDKELDEEIEKLKKGCKTFEKTVRAYNTMRKKPSITSLKDLNISIEKKNSINLFKNDSFKSIKNRSLVNDDTDLLKTGDKNNFSKGNISIGDDY